MVFIVVGIVIFIASGYSETSEYMGTGLNRYSVLFWIIVVLILIFAFYNYYSIPETDLSHLLEFQ